METPDEITARRKREYEAHAAVFGGLPGAAELVAAYDGYAPSFHDAVLLEMKLSITPRKSIVRLSNPYPDIFSQGRLVVTLTLGEVVDLDLQHFMSTNILYRLRVKPAEQRPERRGYHRPLRSDDLEIELEGSVGVGGFIVCSSLSVSWVKDRGGRRADKKSSDERLLGQ